VNEHDERAVEHHPCRRWRRHEAEPGRSFGPIIEGRRRELAATRDEMLVGVDRMMHVVRERRHGFPDAGAIRAVPHASRHAGNQRALDLLLQVEHRRVLLPAQRAAERSEVTPGRCGEEVMSPVSQRDGNDAPDVGVERDERHETGLGDPVDRELGSVCAHVGNERERMDDVAQG
jgi:hypothetical protein